MLGKTINKRIIYDDDGNPKEVSPLKSNHLFSESDDDDDDKSKDELNIYDKTKIIGKTLKLIELRSKLADDPRFKVTEDFIDNESGTDEESYSLKEHKKSIAITIPRFDPSKSDSQKYIVNKNKIVMKEKSIIKEKSIELPAKVKHERFYEVDESLKHSFKNPVNQVENSFSLLKLLGKEDDVSNIEFEKKDDQQNELKVNKGETNCKTKKENKSAKQTNTNNTRSEMKRIRNFTIKNRHIGYEKFFMIEGDIRLKDDSFFRTDLIKHHRDEWDKRQKIMALGFKKRKKKVKHDHQIKQELEKGLINNRSSLYIAKRRLGDKYYSIRRRCDKRNKSNKKNKNKDETSENLDSINLGKSL